MILLILISYTEGQGEHEVVLGTGTSDTFMGVNFEILFPLNSRIIFMMINYILLFGVKLFLSKRNLIFSSCVLL